MFHVKHLLPMDRAGVTDEAVTQSTGGVAPPNRTTILNRPHRTAGRDRVPMPATEMERRRCREVESGRSGLSAALCRHTLKQLPSRTTELPAMFPRGSRHLSLRRRDCQFSTTQSQSTTRAPASPPKGTLSNHYLSGRPCVRRPDGRTPRANQVRQSIPALSSSNGRWHAA
jgi:hypothetical protein